MSDEPGPDVSVVIVPWNVRELTLACLASVESRAREDGLDVEIIVVDNASSDGTAEAVRAAFPRVVVVANRENVGFPIANNQGLVRARGRHVLFLNPDTTVGAGTLRACVTELDASDGVGMVGCRLDFPDGTPQAEAARREYRLRHLVTESLYLHMLFPRSELFAHELMPSLDRYGRHDVEAISGAFMMVRRDVALAIGGMPDEVFMYHDDLGFCLRVRARGWRIRYLGDVQTTHFVNQSSRKSRAQLALLEGESKIRLIREREGAVAAAAARAVFGMRAAARLTIAGAGAVLPGTRAVRERYPRVFDARRHWLQLKWSISPALVDAQMPKPPAVKPVDAAVPVRPDEGWAPGRGPARSGTGGALMSPAR